MNRIQMARKVFDIEIDALIKTRDSLDETFNTILELLINCKGKVIITGMGKPGHIAEKLAATFSSLGTPSFFLHPAEAMHGDLGMVSKDDIVIAISYSGESDEIVRIIPSIKLIGAQLIGITGNGNSTLAKSCDVVQIFPKFEEACNMGLAPTSSTTVSLCYGDALAVVASEIYGFTNNDFGKYHPAGSLGKKIILKVSDIMCQNEKNAVINKSTLLKDAIIELSKKGLGVVNIVNSSNELIGIITDGDLRRQLEKSVNVYDLNVQDIMTTNPTIVCDTILAVDALDIMRKKRLSCLPVINREKKLVGTIRLQDIIEKGII